MAASQLIDCMIALFKGNDRVVGLDDDGHRHPGPRPVRDGSPAVWQTLFRDHLWGKRGIGIYPYNHDAQAVMWGCVDLDDGEDTSWAYALELRTILRAVGLEPWIERSRSKGYHVWVFATEWTPIQWMRQALLGACDLAGCGQAEVNPKSESLNPQQLGNFVRLPYFNGVRPRDRQVVVDLLGKPLPLELFVPEACESRAEPFTIGEVAREYYVAPPVREARPLPEGWTPDYDDAYVTAAVNSAVRQVMNEPEGNRNNRLNAEAYGILRLFPDPEEGRYALELLTEAALFNDIPEREVRSTIASALKARNRPQGETA